MPSKATLPAYPRCAATYVCAGAALDLSVALVVFVLRGGSQVVMKNKRHGLECDIWYVLYGFMAMA